MAIITGTLNSGKGMVAPIVASLQKAEPLRKLIETDQIFYLAHLKKIPKSTAVFFVRHYLDKCFYEQLIGRNLNFRVEDETSIFTAKNTLELSERIFVKRGNHIIKNNVKSKTIFTMDTHDGIMLFDFWKNVNKNFKFINVFRNPIDTVNGCYNIGQGELEKILFNEIIMFKKNKSIFPFHFLSNFKNYNKKTPMDRVIDIVLFCQKHEYKNYKKFKNYKNLLFVENEDFATNTSKNIARICKFLKTKRSNKTRSIMKRENCPRKFDINIYKEKIKKIKFFASKKSFEKLLEQEKTFFRRKKEVLKF